MMAPAMASVACTIREEIELGRMWWTMIRQLLAPMARAASTNSCSRVDITAARTTRANFGVEDRPTASIRLNKLEPSAVTMHMASSIWGMAMNRSIQRIMILSSLG